MPKKYQIKVLNAATDDEPVEILIHGPIGKSFWSDEGISGKEFVDALNEIPKEKSIVIGVNSQGGEVGEGLAFYNAIARRADKITARIDGYALSIASVFPLAAGKIISPKTSIWMIHNASSFSQEDAEGHRQTAELLDKHDMTLVRTYARKTGKTEKEIKAAMKAETWFTGEEAVAYGLADESDEGGDNSTAFAQLDFGRFKNVPENLKPLVTASAKTTSTANSITITTISQPLAGGGNNQNKTKMNKIKMLALLKGMGHELAADASEQVIFAALEKASEANKQAPDSAIAAKLESITTQLNSEKSRRITAAVDGYITQTKLTKDEREDAIARAIADETYLDIIAKRPEAAIGGSPLGIIVMDNRIETIRKEPIAAKRFAMLRKDWPAIHADAVSRENRSARGPVTAANTYSSSLVTQFLVDGATTKLQNRWAPLMAFTRDFSVDRYKPRATGQMKFVASGATAQTNASNFESGDSVVNNVAVSVSQFTAAFHVTNDELNSGLRMENLVDVNVAVIADKVITTATTPITNVLFAAPAKHVSAFAAFTYSDLQAIWGDLKKSPIKYIILDGEYYARIMNNPTYFQRALIAGEPASYEAFGWDGIFLNTNWTGADVGVHGFACNPQAIGALAGLPLTPPNIPGATLMETSFMVPQVDISVANYSWFSLATRTMWASYDLMFGAAQLDSTAGEIISTT